MPLPFANASRSTPPRTHDDVSMPCRSAPAVVVDAVRLRIAPLFPHWGAERIEALVCQIAAVEWRYSAGSDVEAGRLGQPSTDLGGDRGRSSAEGAS